MNPRPPRCERGALPAELLPHLRAGKHFRRFAPALSIRAPGKRTSLPYEIRSLGYPGSAKLVQGHAPSVLPSRYVAVFMTGSASLCGRRGEFFETMKFFFVLPINPCVRVPGLRRKHAPYPVATEKIFAVEKKDRRKQRGEEITPSDGIPSASPSRPVARVCARSRTGQGLAPRTPARKYDFLLTERAFFEYSKPSPRD